MGKENKNGEDKEPRCVLTLPLYPEPWQVDIIEKRFHIMEHLENSLTALELRKLRNLKRTKRYKDLEHAIAEEKDATKRGKLVQERNKFLSKSGINEFAFIADVSKLQKHFAEHIGQKVGSAAAKHVWTAFDKVVFKGGFKIHFHRKGELKSVATSEIGASMSIKNNILVWSGGIKGNKDKRTGKSRKVTPIKICIKIGEPETYYEKEMLQKQIKYVTIVRKWIKNRYKYYLQFMLVGNPVAKPRTIANGKRVGIDIGTSSVAIVSGKEIKLVELADKVQKNHDKKAQLQRSMDLSRRAMNPQNFNKDGTIKRGIKLIWVESKHYKEMKGQVRELERKNADVRKYQHTCLANYVLSLGTEVYIEQMSFKGLQRKAKETKYDKNGKPKRKKRFGKSIANRAPATFVMILKNKLSGIAGEELRKVNTFTFKASQYDHTNNTYQKKLLRHRWAKLSNGDKIQRDLYSAFLLMNSDTYVQHTDQNKCKRSYKKFKIQHDELIKAMQESSKRYPKSFGIN